MRTVPHAQGASTLQSFLEETVAGALCSRSRQLGYSCPGKAKPCAEHRRETHVMLEAYRTGAPEGPSAIGDAVSAEIACAARYFDDAELRELFVKVKAAAWAAMSAPLWDEGLTRVATTMFLRTTPQPERRERDLEAMRAYMRGQLAEPGRFITPECYALYEAVGLLLCTMRDVLAEKARRSFDEAVA